MLDIERMRKEKRDKAERRQFKTYLKQEAIERLQAVADYTGVFLYEIVEELILTELPEVDAPLEG